MTWICNRTLQDEPNWHRADTDKYESEGEGELYEFGQESLDRLALAMGGNTVAPLAARLLPTLLAEPDWKKRHAALICISQIAEGCVKVLVKNVRGLADMCMQVRCSTPCPPYSWQYTFQMPSFHLRIWLHVLVFPT